MKSNPASFKQPLTAFMLCFVAASPLPSLANNLTQSIDSLTKQWLQIEQQEQNLMLDWQQRKPAIIQRIELLKSERAQLQAILSKNSQNQDDVENKRNELLTEQNQLETEQAELRNLLSGLINQLDNKYQALPDPVKSLWDKEQTDIDLEAQDSTNLQLVIAKLSRAQQFDDQITINETLFVTPDNKEVLVKQLYLGLGFAWFASNDGAYIGYGRVQQGQWQWHYDDNINSTALLKAIAIYEKRQTPSFVELPLFVATQKGHK